MNDILLEIVLALNATVTNPKSRNQLLRDWLAAYDS